MTRKKREAEYQAHIKERLYKTFPKSFVKKMSTSDTPGVPDLLVLNGDRWALLEVKRSADEPHRPNQDRYVDIFNQMSYSSFIYPENEEEVFHELERTFQTSG